MVRFITVLCLTLVVSFVGEVLGQDSDGLTISPVGKIEVGPVEKVDPLDPVNNDKKKGRPEDTKAWTIFSRKKASDDTESWKYEEVLDTGGNAQIKALKLYKMNGKDSLAFPYKVDPEKWKSDRESVVKESTKVVEAKRLKWVEAKWVDVPGNKQLDTSSIKLKLAPGVRAEDKEMIDRILKHAKQLTSEASEAQFLGTWYLNEQSKVRYILQPNGKFLHTFGKNANGEDIVGVGTWSCDGDNVDFGGEWEKFKGKIVDGVLKGRLSRAYASPDGEGSVWKELPDEHSFYQKK